jgi:hypothetical protein
MWARVKEWLTTHSDFMNSVGFLSTMAHVGWAALITLTASLFSLRLCIMVSGALIIFATIKEYYFDATFERPKQSWKDNTQDFLGYLGGIGLAWVVVMIHKH